MSFSQHISHYHISQLAEVIPEIQAPALVYLYGEVGVGKTTFVSQYIAQKLSISPESITSPTYVYYNIYQDIIHFDLYRVENYDVFISIGGEEIIENNTGIIFIEWPEILEPHFQADICIYFEKSQHDENRRNMRIEFPKN